MLKKLPAKKIYCKRIAKIDKFTVWSVNGKQIRDNLDEEFTNFGQHYRFNFIPANEFWIDKENEPGEEKYFIDHLLVENRLMSEGKSLEQAIDQADRIERRERHKSKLMERVAKYIQHKDEVINKIHKQLLLEYGDEIKIWLVYGELVRDLFYTDFTEGGHDKIFSFIPTNEIWIDDDISPKERKYVILHELHERNIMPVGRQSSIKNKTLVVDNNYVYIYDTAHKSAARLEYYCRHHPQVIDKKIKNELKISHAKNKKDKLYDLKIF